MLDPYKFMQGSDANTEGEEEISRGIIADVETSVKRRTSFYHDFATLL